MKEEQQDIPVVDATTAVAATASSVTADTETVSVPSTPEERPSLASADTNGKSSRVLFPKNKSKVMDKNQIYELQQQGFSRGLAEAMTQNNLNFPLRIWVVDNSASMNSADGTRIVPTKRGGIRLDDCTRWDELRETVEYHAKLAGLLQAPTVFRLLNEWPGDDYPQQFSVAERGAELVQADIDAARHAMSPSPKGTTPLTAHIREIRQNILELEPTLKETGRKVAIVLATDGCPTDGGNQSADFIDALRSLEGLPVWVVIRLCTDDTNVVDFYNELDGQLELSLEVLDDFEMEAKEVYQYNRFLNYTLPLHRCREMGYYSRLFDLLDERKLTLDELREFLGLIFGETAFDGVPDPHVDWPGFAQAVSSMNDQEGNQWNPITKRVQPWVNMRKMNKSYSGQRSGCNVM